MAFEYQSLCARLPLNLRFTPEHLLNSIKNLGLIIDLTNTDRYYHAQSEFINRGVKYEKIFCEGKVVPSTNVVQRFFRIIDNYIAQFPETDNLIGVHCTHGINRTGYLVCSYMIQRMGFDPSTAILEFNKARECPMERENYIQALHLNYNRSQNRNLNEQSQPRLLPYRQEHRPSRPSDDYNRPAPHHDDRYRNRNRSRSNDRRDLSSPYDSRPPSMIHSRRQPNNNHLIHIETTPAPVNSSWRSPRPAPHYQKDSNEEPVPSLHNRKVPYQELVPSPHNRNSRYQEPVPALHTRKSPYQVPVPTPHIRKSPYQVPVPSSHNRRSHYQEPDPSSRRGPYNDHPTSSQNNNYVDNKGVFNRQKYVWKKKDEASSPNRQSLKNRQPFNRK